MQFGYAVIKLYMLLGLGANLVKDAAKTGIGNYFYVMM